MSSTAIGTNQRIVWEHRRAAIGLEVHVDGWGHGPFFRIVGYNEDTERVMLSTRYSERVKYKVPVGKVYFTARCAKAYAEYLAKKGVTQ